MVHRALCSTGDGRVYQGMDGTSCDLQRIRTWKPGRIPVHMSCGYNLEGIKDKKIDDFIEGMKDARDTEIFRECRTWLLEHIALFEHVTREDIEAIPSEICNSITLSTMHGCPPQEIENIVMYLLRENTSTPM